MEEKVEKNTKKVINRLPKFSNTSDIAKETIMFLQDNIRIDTSNPPGNELTLAKLIQEKFEKEKNPLIRTKIIETVPSRGNLIVTIQGSDPSNNPCWGFASHLDVVPVGEDEEWKYPPFSGELVQMEHDKFIWGRGAADMKQIGVSYVMALLTLLREGFQPKGNIKLIFEADEERGGEEGMGILMETHWEEIKMDYLLTESGGYKLPTGKDFVIQTGEKGKCQLKIKATGVAGHASAPDPYEQFAMYKIVKILEKIRKRKPKIYMIREYKQTIEGLSLPKVLKFIITRKRLVRGILSFLSKITHDPFDKFFIPMITDTIAPTIIKAGNKVNVISPTATLSLDIRTLPDHDRKFILKNLERLLGKKLYTELEITPVDDTLSTTSPINTIFYEKIQETLSEMYPGGGLVPILDVGGSDMKHLRQKNVPCYGFSLTLKDPDLSYDELIGMEHSPNERISVTNLMIATEFIYRLMKGL